MSMAFSKLIWGGYHGMEAHTIGDTMWIASLESIQDCMKSDRVSCPFMAAVHFFFICMVIDGIYSNFS